MRISLYFKIFLEAEFIRIVAFMLFHKNIWQKPCVSPRSYIDQEHGKYGFSAMTLVYYIFLLNDEEILTFIGELRYLMGRRKEDVAESHI